MTPFLLRAAWAWTAGAPRVLERPEILVERGRIAWMGQQGTRPARPGEAVVDLGEAWLLPGMIDAHLHLWGLDGADPAAAFAWPLAYRAARAAGELAALLRAGITSARCMGGPLGLPLARALREWHLPGPRLVAAGDFLCARGGTWDQVAWPSERVEALGILADGPEACRRAVRERARAGADLVKIGGSVGLPSDALRPWGDDPARQRLAFSDEEVAAVVAEAHRQGLKVATHAIGDAAVRQALGAGVDFIEHGHGISEETCRWLAGSGAVLTPTLSLPALRRGVPGPASAAWARHAEAQARSLELAARHGVPMAAGTDFIGPPHSPHGPNAGEVARMAEAGLPAEAALEAMFLGGRRALGLEGEAGELAAGRVADLVAVQEDPRRAPSALLRPLFVLRAGRVARDDAGAAPVLSRAVPV